MTDTFERLSAALADRYTIERELGAGGMATVYLADDLKNRRQVAVKVLRPELAAAIGAERFLREIEIAANLTHPHILPLFDSGDADGFLYYAMPYIEGESLRDRLVRDKQLPVDDAIEIARQVARALGYAHDRNVVHRDIKPENILLAEGEAVVADFGIAKAINAAGGDALTQTGMSVGTPAYMSPEQAGGSGDLDGRSDLYGLGCVLYEMLAGQAPFTGPTVESLVHQHLAADAPSVSVIRQAVPSEIAQVIQRAMAKNPADRFATATEFADALKPVGVTSATGTVASATSAPQRRMGIIAAAVFVVVAAVAWGFTRTGGSAGGDSDIPRIVVLPFENLGSPDDEFFADGMTEEITSRLANISGLRVIARQSAIQYKGSTLSSREIAEELNVDYVLEGTVRTDRVEGGAGQVRISPQLIRASDETHVWAQPSTVALVPGQIFSVQAEVAEQVARALNVVLSDAEHESIDIRPTDNLEAYELYLRGNIHFARRTNEEDAHQAVEYYQRAANVDPRFVDVLAALSKARSWLKWNWGLQEELAKARAVLDSARVLAPDRDFDIAAAYYHYYGERDYTAALERLQRVEARQPSNAEVAALIGFIFRRQGEWESATVRIQRAFDLNPKDPIMALALGETYGVRGQFAAAVRYLDQSLALTPSVWAGHGWKAWVYVHEDRGTVRAWEVVRAAAEQVIHPGLLSMRANLHRLDRDYGAAAAIAEVTPSFGMVAGERWEMHYLAGQDALARTWADSARRVYESTLRSRPNYGTHARLGAVYAVLGRTADAIREAERAKELLPMTVDALDGTRVLWDAARTYLLVGQVEDAIDHLETLVAAPFRLGIPPLDLDPIWDPIRDHPRFQRLLLAKQ